MRVVGVLAENLEPSDRFENFTRRTNGEVCIPAKNVLIILITTDNSGRYLLLELFGVFI